MEDLGGMDRDAAQSAPFTFPLLLSVLEALLHVLRVPDILEHWDSTEGGVCACGGGSRVGRIIWGRQSFIFVHCWLFLIVVWHRD